MEIWPNFFIVGGPKAGTTSLYEYLKKIPGIYMSPNKEPHYFSKKLIPDNDPFLKPIRDKKKYLKLFKSVTTEKIIGEASTSYLTDPDAARLIHEVIPNAKILISIRDPVDVVYSHYLMLLRLARIKSSFHEKLTQELDHKFDKRGQNLILAADLYSKNISRFYEYFGQKQVKVIVFEDFIKNIKNVLQDVLNFLGSDHKIDYEFEKRVHNPYGVANGPIARTIFGSKTVKTMANRMFSSSTRESLIEKLVKKQPKPEMNEEDKVTLVNFFKDDVEKLKNLLGIELPWKNFSFNELKD